MSSKLLCSLRNPHTYSNKRTSPSCHKYNTIYPLRPLVKIATRKGSGRYDASNNFTFFSSKCPPCAQTLRMRDLKMQVLIYWNWNTRVVQKSCLLFFKKSKNDARKIPCRGNLIFECRNTLIFSPVLSNALTRAAVSQRWSYQYVAGPS